MGRGRRIGEKSSNVEKQPLPGFMETGRCVKRAYAPLNTTTDPPQERQAVGPAPSKRLDVRNARAIPLECEDVEGWIDERRVCRGEFSPRAHGRPVASFHAGGLESSDLHRRGKAKAENHNRKYQTHSLETCQCPFGYDCGKRHRTRYHILIVEVVVADQAAMSGKRMPLTSTPKMSPPPIDSMRNKRVADDASIAAVMAASSRKLRAQEPMSKNSSVSFSRSVSRTNLIHEMIPA